MRRVLAAAVLAALAGLTACSGSLHLTDGGLTHGGLTGANPALPSAGTGSLPLDGRTAAELDIVSGFSTVSVTAAPIGGRLLEVTGTPATAPPTAAATGDTVAVSSGHPVTGGPVSDAVQIVLNSSVRWQVALSGGAASAIVDLSAARVSSVEVVQGVSSLEVTLPAQAGTTEVTLAAGASSLRVHTRGGEPARATLSAGAGSAVIDGETHSGVAAGSSFTGAGWDTATARVDIECSAGVGALVVDEV